MPRCLRFSKQYLTPLSQQNLQGSLFIALENERNQPGVKELMLKPALVHQHTVAVSVAK